MIDIEKPFEDEKRTTEGRLDREVRKSVSNCRKKQVRVSRRPVVLIVGICSELVNTKKKKKTPSERMQCHAKRQIRCKGII